MSMQVINFCSITDDSVHDIVEDASTKHPLAPSQVCNAHFVYLVLKEFSQDADEILGKWMIFKHFDEIDATWEKIRSAIIRRELLGCWHAKCSTMRYHPTSGGPGPALSAVICVYTEEHEMDAIGFKLIEIVQQDIKYKTDYNTMKRRFAFTVGEGVSLKTIFWNNGKPSFVREGQPCRGTSFKRRDDWHLNVVEAPKSLNLGAVHGRWVLVLEYEELTRLWHSLKAKIESEEDNFGVIRMVCPAKRERRSPTEMPEFHFYTSEERRKSVGLKLIKIVEDDIVYQCKPPGAEHGAGFRCKPREEVLFWNEGEPDWVKRKGIAKN